MLSSTIGRSPCITWMSTAVCPSSAVEKTCDLRAGMVVLRSITWVITPPMVSTPSESGVTSSRSTSFTSPVNTPAWMAAPMATTSSGLTLLFGSLLISLRTNSWITGMRLAPPTRTTSSISLTLFPASFKTASKGVRQRSTRSLVSCSRRARVRRNCRCLGPLASAVI